MKKNTHWKYALLLAGITLTGPLAAMTADSVSPRAENYPSFSQYLQALFEYRKAQKGSDSSASAAICKDEKDKGSKHQNACRSRSGADSADTQVVDSSLQPSEDLDAAIARAALNRNINNPDNNVPTRSTANNFPLTSIDGDDLSKMGVNGLLGFLGGLLPAQLPGTTASLRPDSSLVLTPGGDIRLSGDYYNQLVSSLQGQILEMVGGTIILPDGQGFATATLSLASDGGLDMTLSSTVHTSLYIVDRDGLPGTVYKQAGAVVVNDFGVNISDLHAHIKGIPGPFGSPNSIFVQATSQDPILFDFSGTRIGVASATPDAATAGIARTYSRAGIGQPSYYLGFGPGSQLAIGPNLNMTTILTTPDGLLRPFITLNGKIGDINLNDISLLSDNGSGDDVSLLRIKKVKVTGLNMVNTRVYFDQDKIVVDLGTGMTNVGVGISGLSIGTNPNAPPLGQISLDNMSINTGRIAIGSH
jgi:hypothetical protein